MEAGFELVSGYGPAEQKSLGDADAEMAQELSLGFALNALDDQLKAQRAEQFDDCGENLDRGVPLGDALKERAVKFDPSRGNFAQPVQRGVGAAEVVQADSDPSVMQADSEFKETLILARRL
jgi:hypothetical protein